LPQQSHQSAPTQFVEANGIRFAYRRFGKAGGVPIVFNLHCLGTMDYWDPDVTDGLARNREVILFDNAGVSSRSGEVPTTFEQMGANAVAFTQALGLNKVDGLGFSVPPMIRPGISDSRSSSVRPRRPSRRTGVPEAQASSSGRPRSRGERQGFVGPD
jgi:hypothetical protein